MLKYKLLKEIISYKLLKMAFLSLLKSDEENFVFLYINDTRSRTYLEGTQVSNFLYLMGNRISQEILLPPYFELMDNQIILTFPTSQEVLLPVLFLRTKQPIKHKPLYRLLWQFLVIRQVSKVEKPAQLIYIYIYIYI